MTRETLNQEKRKAENARHWVAASAESQTPSERGSVRLNEAVRPTESQRMGGDSLRVKSIRSWVKQGGPGRQVALILAALLIGVPVALLVLEPLLSVVVTVLLGIVMVRALLAGAGHGRGSDSDEEVEFLATSQDDDSGTPYAVDVDGDLCDRHGTKIC